MELEGKDKLKIVTNHLKKVGTCVGIFDFRKVQNEIDSDLFPYRMVLSLKGEYSMNAIVINRSMTAHLVTLPDFKPEKVYSLMSEKDLHELLKLLSHKKFVMMRFNDLVYITFMR